MQREVVTGRGLFKRTEQVAVPQYNINRKPSWRIGIHRVQLDKIERGDVVHFYADREVVITPEFRQVLNDDGYFDPDDATVTDFRFDTIDKRDGAPTWVLGDFLHRQFTQESKNQQVLSILEGHVGNDR